MREWAMESKDHGTLVGIFPLLISRSHFTLLEINERQRFIYHYDSLGNEHSDLKVWIRLLSKKCQN